METAVVCSSLDSQVSRHHPFYESELLVRWPALCSKYLSVLVGQYIMKPRDMDWTITYALAYERLLSRLYLQSLRCFRSLQYLHIPW